MNCPAEVLTVADAADLRAAVADAAADGRRLRIRGGDSRRGALGEIAADAVLDLSALNGVIAYEPGELVLRVGTGTPLLEVQLLLAQNRQHLAFEPQDLAGLLGGAPGTGTIGGVVASGLAGPRRVAAGNVRDHLLGFEGVSGRGEAFRGGGQVIKNVTGYDLPKLMTGSWGTLAALDQVTLRVLPQPAYALTLSVEDLDDDAALATLRTALGATSDITGAACLPRDRRALIRLEGFQDAVRENLQMLQALLGARAPMRVIEDQASQAIWQRVGEVWDFQGDARAVWRLSLPSTCAAAVVARLRQARSLEAVYDWGGSLVWLATEASADVATAVREVAGAAGGHAWLFRAPPALRARVPAAHPQPAALQALSVRIKKGFDPLGVFPDAPLTEVPREPR